MSRALYRCFFKLQAVKCRAEEGERGGRGQTLALAGIVSCLEMDLLMDESWPVHGLSQCAVAHDLVDSGLLEALKGALTKFQGNQRLLALEACVLIAHHPGLHSKCTHTTLFYDTVPACPHV